MTRADRTRLPALGPSPAFRFARVHKDALLNGLSLRSVEQRTLPVITFMLVLPVGSAADFEGYEGLAAITADMVDEGTGNLTAIDVNFEFARIAAHFETEVTADATIFTVTSLTRYARRALALLADCVVRPRLDNEDFERVQQLRLTRLVQLRDLPSAIADRAFMQVVYGTHPYAHTALGTAESLRQLTVEGVRQFHASSYAPSRATLVAAGDLTADELREMASSAFAQWQDGPSPAGEDAALTPPPPTPVHGLVIVDKPGAAQSEIRIGSVGLSRSTPDYFALIVLNMVLGGQFVSRINMTLRQEKGLTYGARTSFDFRRGRGPFLMQTSVQISGTADAVATSMAEVRALRDERPPTPDEVDVAKAALTRGYSRNFETAEQVARAIAQMGLYHLPDDYFDMFTTNVDKVSVEQAREVASTHLDPDRLAAVIVSDSAIVTPQLHAAGFGEATPLLPRL